VSNPGAEHQQIPQWGIEHWQWSQQKTEQLDFFDWPSAEP